MRTSLCLVALLALSPGCGDREMIDGPVYTTGSGALDTGDPSGSSGAETGGTGGDDSAGGSSSGATASGGTSTSDGSAGGSTGPGPTGDPGTTGNTSGGGDLEPPAGGSSGGSGGGAASGEVRQTATGGVTYRVIAPAGSGPFSAMVVYSGTEGGQAMTSNITQLKDYAGLGNVVFGILDGVQYNGDGQAGAYVLDDLRADYDIDNDTTYLLSESAGTGAGLQLGFQLRPSYFAAYWANDVNTSAVPGQTTTELGFAPWGNAGPGGDWPDANAIVDGMMSAGYRTPAPAPYDGPGSDTHGHPDQFIAAMQWFAGKSRQ